MVQPPFRAEYVYLLQFQSYFDDDKYWNSDVPSSRDGRRFNPCYHTSDIAEIQAMVWDGDVRYRRLDVVEHKQGTGVACSIMDDCV